MTLYPRAYIEEAMNATCQHCGKEVVDTIPDDVVFCEECQRWMEAEIDRMVNEGGPDVQRE